MGRLLGALSGLVVACGLALADPLVDALATEDPRALAAAVTAVERAPTTAALADALFAAARACEDRLRDPARALALYERILRELPDARVATAARRRAERLRAEVGAGGEHAREAAELADLIARADALVLPDVVARGHALATRDWAGAPDAALWLAEYLRRQRLFAEAQARYAAVVARWPGTAQARAAMRGGVGNAIDAGAWDRAERLAARLPAVEPADRILRDDLYAEIARGRLRARIHTAAWLALLGAIAGLLGSLADAMVRGGFRAPSPRPPFEVLFLGPVAIVLIAIGFTGNLTVAPAVAMIALGGLALSWVSGATLDLVRARGRAVRGRAVLHALACIFGAVALGYLTLVHDGLLDMLVETIKYGPGA